MGKTRVLIADDSALIRRMLGDTLAADPALEVAATAANGRFLLAKLDHVNPDVVILDVEMPEMDGLQTLAELRKTHPRLPVIMFSTLTDRGASATLDALALGATDYVTKPSNVGSLDVAQARVREELIPKIKELALRATPSLFPVPRANGGATATGVARTGLSSSSPGKLASRNAAPSGIDVVAIGVSTGGPNALAEVLPRLPADLPVPIVIVQHMPPVFTKLLAERLAAKSAVKIGEGAAGVTLRPGEVWIAPGGSHMTVERAGVGVRLALNQDPPENSCRPAVDVLFRSVARVYGARSLVVMMTGMGQDGLRGCEPVREAGGQIIAQDEASSVVWSMPGAVVRAGLADSVLPLGQLAQEITRRASLTRRAPAVA